MDWVDQYQSMIERDKQFFQTCLNRLLAQSYLVYHREEDRPFYRFVDRHWSLFEGYVGMAGWKLDIAKELTVISLRNTNDQNRRQLNQVQTLFLFILRLIYEEKLRELSLAKLITTTHQEIYEKYIALKIKNRLPAQDEYQRILKIFVKHSLLEVENWFDPEALIFLYPSILLAVPVQAIDLWNDWIDTNQSAQVDLDELEDMQEELESD